MKTVDTETASRNHCSMVIDLIGDYEKSINRKIVQEFFSFGRDGKKIFVRLTEDDGERDLRENLTRWILFRLDDIRIFPTRLDQVSFIVMCDPT